MQFANSIDVAQLAIWLFWGFFVVAAVLFLLAALAAFIASRAFKAGSPPTPELAIDEAKRIRETVQSPELPERTA